jgi:hypothetical protein
MTKFSEVTADLNFYRDARWSADLLSMALLFLFKREGSIVGIIPTADLDRAPALHGVNKGLFNHRLKDMIYYETGGSDSAS